MNDELSSWNTLPSQESQIEVVCLPISCWFPGGSRPSLEFNRIYLLQRKSFERVMLFANNPMVDTQPFTGLTVVNRPRYGCYSQARLLQLYRGS
jgi:hypothetical protein